MITNPRAQTVSMIADVGVQPAGRSHQDDPAVPGRPHHPHRGPRQPDAPEQVDREHFLELRNRLPGVIPPRAPSQADDAGLGRTQASACAGTGSGLRVPLYVLAIIRLGASGCSQLRIRAGH